MWSLIDNMVGKRKIKRRVKKRSNLWRESWEYLKESRNYIYLVIVLFFVSAGVGFGFPDYFTGFNDLLKGLTEQIEGLGHLGLIWFILQNNVISAFIGMMLGVLLGIVPVFNSLLNGALLGYVFYLASAQGGLSVIWYIVPHGIFELPAIFIALGLGVRFGMFVFAGKGKRKREFRKRFWGSVKVFLTVVLPLLIIAAVIEGTLIFFAR